MLRNMAEDLSVKTNLYLIKEEGILSSSNNKSMDYGQDVLWGDMTVAVGHL